MSDLKGRIEALMTAVRVEVEGGSGQKGTYGTGIDLESKPLMARGEDGEYEDTRNLDNKGILQK